MTPFASERRRSKLPLVIALIAVVGAMLAGGAVYLWPRLESAPPTIVLSPDVDVVGTGPIELRLADQGTGLKEFSATLSQGGGEIKLAAETFVPPVQAKTLTLALAKVPGVKEGPAVLRVAARDASWRHNETVLQKNVTIDVTPPTIELVADDRYVNFGGVGVIVYKAAADTESSGVRIGNHFFPGHGGQVKGHPDWTLALFAHPYDTPADARATIVATDRAGNTREQRLAYELKDVRYRKSTIALSDAFLQNKVAPLLSDAASRQAAPRELFVAVNRKLRKENEDRITEITTKSTPVRQWDGAFMQLTNSKVEANFADQRTYTLNGEAIDTAYHLGYDLSVTKGYPVEAANSGTVAFTGDLGIYGNTVIIDHGLGLYTLYSHLSAIDVKPGDALKKGQILGKTGETGLAAGDHLHYGVYLDGVAVLPVEWWDAKWIDDNITPKLEGRSGAEIAEAQAPARKKAPNKPAAKKTSTKPKKSKG
jgi:murein DD-endopeptidase MepM/ murein hydrolase activator NlpD